MYLPYAVTWLLAMTNVLFAETEMLVKPNENIDGYDILIIGAGITGLAHTHLFSTLTDQNYKTLTVERFNRICGRTHSSTLTHNNKSITFEHGAMRFYYDEYHQKFLHRMKLCDNIVPFEHSFFGNLRPKSNFLYRNTIHHGSSNLSDFFYDIYNIDSNEREWMIDADLPVSMGYEQILEENTDKKCAAFWDEWTLKGVLVKNWDVHSFWKNILDTSIEYYNYENKNGRIVADGNVAMMFLGYIKKIYKNDRSEICDIGDDFPGFDDEFSAKSIVDLQQEGGIFWDQYIVYNESNTNTTHFTLDIGYDEICKRLYRNSSSYDNNNFLFEYNVIAVDKQNTNAGGIKYAYKVTLQSVHDLTETKTVYAHKVISTIAPNHLSELLKHVNFGENTPMYNEYIQNKLIDSAFLDRSYKVSLIYDDRWWQDINLTDYAGHLLTDLNIQTFLMEKSWRNDTLTVVHFYIWGDEQSHLFHRLQQFGPKYKPDAGIFVSNENTLILSSEILVNETLKQLSELIEYDVPLPLAAYSSPLGYNFSHNSGVWRWKAGYDIHYTLDNIIKPKEDEDFFITTSSISPDQGWMYGGIWAAIQNVKLNFGITDPLKNEPTCIPNPEQ